uniref:Uncharacterized protein n=1 Tax=Corvus moneduloides TaxID=1196302 RepID=A0A8U7NBL2_CORMO
MAEPSLAEQLRAEASCPVCLELFQDPVSVPCGHNFCRGCIERCWESSRGSFCCPRCRNVAPERGLRPSRELGHVADIARGLLPGVPGTLCSRSRAHWLHRVVPAEEAAQEYKVTPAQPVESGFLGGKMLWNSQLGGEGRDLGPFPIPCPHRRSRQDKTRSEGQRMVWEFQELRRFLEEQERLLLVQLGDLDRAIGRAQDEALAKVSEELSQKSTSASLSLAPPHPPVTLQSRRKWKNGAGPGAGRDRSISIVPDSPLKLPYPAANVTLDPSTAHPNLQLSEDGKEVRGQLVPRDVPDHPERFDFEPCVLARGGFASGRHFWEVEVGQGGVWALGVVRESARRRGPLSLTPKEGVWALEAFHSLTSPRANLRLHPPPRRLRVSLDYEGRRVAFFTRFSVWGFTLLCPWRDESSRVSLFPKCFLSRVCLGPFTPRSGGCSPPLSTFLTLLSNKRTFWLAPSPPCPSRNCVHLDF